MLLPGRARRADTGREIAQRRPAVYTPRLSTQLAIYAHGAGWGRGCADSSSKTTTLATRCT